MRTLKFNYYRMRFARGPLRYFWVVVWVLGQVVSPMLDKYDKHPQETASYSILTKEL
jgi:hypothetical protein